MILTKSRVFAQPIPLERFNHWLRRLQDGIVAGVACNPLPLGPGKAHLYAVDMVSYETVDIEFTCNWIVGAADSEVALEAVDRLAEAVAPLEVGQ